METARDLIGGVRDYHQSKVANDQNEVMKRLTLVASIFLPPTFIVGVYGQNFAAHAGARVDERLRLLLVGHRRQHAGPDSVLQTQALAVAACAL